MSEKERQEALSELNNNPSTAAVVELFNDMQAVSSNPVAASILALGVVLYEVSGNITEALYDTQS